MNILQVIPSKNPSGIGKYVLNVSIELQKLGHKVVVLHYSKKLKQYLEQNGIKNYYFSVNIFNIVYQLQKLKMIIYCEKINVVNFHHRTIFALMMFITERFYKIPCVFTVHNPKVSDIIKYFLSKNIITLSEVVAKRLGYFGKLFKTKRIFLSFLGTNILPEQRLALVDPQEEKEKFGIPKDLPVVSFISRLSRRKGRVVFEIIKAARLLNLEICLLIVGDGPIVKKVIKKAKKINETSKTKIFPVGYVENVVRIISLSDCVIGTATVVFEAMSCGKPVIAIGRYGYVGIVTPENFNYAVKTCFGDHAMVKPVIAENICEDIKRLILDKKFSEKLGKFGKEMITRKYNTHMMAVSLEKIYDECRKNFNSKTWFTW